MKSENTDISQLIEGCKKNDRTCQRKIYEMLYSKMMSVCMRYSSSRDEAHDVLQDGFIKVFEKIRLYNNDGVFEGWVRRIIVNTAIDAIRKKKHEFLTDDTTPYQKEVEEDENDSIYSSIKSDDIMNAIHNLSPMYRAVFNLYVMEGMSHQEIAEELNITVGTSKSNLFKAKANMKLMLMNKLNR